MRISAVMLILVAMWLGALSSSRGQARPELTVALGHPEGCAVSAFSPDGTLLATVVDGVEARVWQTASGLLYRAIVLPVGYTLAQAQPNPMMAMPQGQATATRMAFSLDNRYLAAAMTGPNGPRLVGWDLRTGKIAINFVPTADDAANPNPMPMDIYRLAFLPDGATLVAQTMNALQYYTFASGKLLSTFGPKENMMVQSLVVSPNGSLLAAQFQGADPANPQIAQGCKIWEAKSGKLLHTLDGMQFFPGTLHFSADGGQLISTNMMNAQTCVADTATGKIYAPVTHAARPTSSELMTPYHSFFGVWSAEKINFYQADATEPFINITDRKGAIHSALVSPTGVHLAYSTLTDAGETGLYLVTLEDQKRVWLRESRNPMVARLFFAPNGKMLAVAGPSTHLLLVNLVSGNVAKRYTAPAYDYSASAFSPDGKLTAFAGTGYDNLLLMDAATGNEKYKVPIGKNVSLRLQFTNDAKMLLAGTGARGPNGTRLTTRGIATKDGTVAWQQDGWLLDASPDGLAVAVMQPRQGGIRLLDAATGAVLGQLATNTICERAAFSSFEPLVAAAGSRFYLFWQLPNTKPAASGRMNTAITALALSPKAGQAAIGCDDGSITLVSTDPKSDTPNRTLPGGGVGISTLAYSPKGDLLAAGDIDGRLLLWDVAAGTKLAEWQFFPVAKDGLTELNWLVTTPDGYLHCAESTKPLLGWRAGDTVKPFSEHEKTYLDPEKVKEALKRP